VPSPIVACCQLFGGASAGPDARQPHGGATSLSYVITSADIGAQLEIVATSTDTDPIGWLARR
jgi:hypothetical protein